MQPESGRSTLPPVDAEKIAEAQVTVAVVLAGFAFAGFVFLLTRVGKKKTRSRDPDRFAAMLLLAGAFSIGTFGAFLYATSRGIGPWPAYRSLITAHGSFVLLAIVTVAAVVKMLELRSAGESFLPHAWGIAAFMMSFFHLRFIAELFRAETHLDGGSTVVAWLMVVVAVLALIAGIVLAAWGSLSTGKNPVMPYIVGLAGVGALIGAVHTYFSYTDSASSVPTAISLLLAAATTLFAAWSVVVSYPRAAPLEAMPEPDA